MIGLGRLGSIAQWCTDISGNNRMKPCCFQHFTNPCGRRRFSVRARNADDRSLAQVIGNLYFSYNINTKLQCLGDGRCRIRNTWVLDDKFNTRMNQAFWMSPAYNRNSQSLQLGCFGTLLSVLLIIYSYDRAKMMQGFGDSHTAFC
ncbi:hypothetical protein D3C78_816050 [compost metagenome]